MCNIHIMGSRGEYKIGFSNNTPRDPLREFWLSIPTYLYSARLDVLVVGMGSGKEHFH